jgi:archaemetzincin
MTDAQQPIASAPIVAVIPFGTAPPLAAEVIAAHVSGYLNLAAERWPPMALPARCRCDKRRQYDAADLITTLESMAGDDNHKIIGLFDVDLFIPLFTHVFGEARQNGRAAIVSLYRLGTDLGRPAAIDERILERMAKIALHELGHLLNLLHCDDDRCLMHFSGDLEVLDRITFNFCRYCRTIRHH